GLAELLPATQDGLLVDLHERAGSWASTLGQLGDAVATVAAVLVIAIAVFGASVAHRPRQVLTSLAAGMLAAALAILFSRLAGTTPGTVSAEEAQLATVAAAVAIAAAT